jgi:hypothetical protein
MKQDNPHKSQGGGESEGEANQESDDDKATYWHDLHTYLNYLFSENWIGLSIFAIAITFVLSWLQSNSIKPIWWGYTGIILFLAMTVFAITTVVRQRSKVPSLAGRQNTPVTKSSAVTISPTQSDLYKDGWAMDPVIVRVTNNGNRPVYAVQVCAYPSDGNNTDMGFQIVDVLPEHEAQIGGFATNLEGINLIADEVETGRHFVMIQLQAIDPHQTRRLKLVHNRKTDTSATFSVASVSEMPVPTISR